ncbi:unnamed protein product [Eruca vesicaria subsp. sativa]|uniref:Uncharacterized protein n=1 Tax=Eruca vesicaria subsp. sativa TaxID=29727 RepID=A0ABC8K0A3_ERUVS|nr:unnamed protein product [Eruca vesicaria subsp. sativa]
MVDAEDLIPPSDDLKIGALSDEDHQDDDEMQEEIVGNELMTLQSDDVLGDELTEMERHDELIRKFPITQFL